LVETATDNGTRTVANVRAIFNKGGGSMGNSGSVAFVFNRMGEFKLKADGINQEEFEMEAIDFGMEEMGEDSEGNLIVRTAFEDFGRFSEFLESKKIEPISNGLTRIPSTTVELDEAKSEEIFKLVDKLEQDEDVQKVYHNLV
jgi:transcriptional/translational regulatory protein YebC/TACO1